MGSGGVPSGVPSGGSSSKQERNDQNGHFGVAVGFPVVVSLCCFVSVFFPLALSFCKRTKGDEARNISPRNGNPEPIVEVCTVHCCFRSNQRRSDEACCFWILEKKKDLGASFVCYLTLWNVI